MYSFLKKLTNLRKTINIMNEKYFSCSLPFQNRIVWLDMEMTGLDIEKDKILEIACLVTDSELNIVAEGPDIIIHQPTRVLENMNDWSIRQHEKTGLTASSKNSKVSEQSAEDQVFHFISQHVAECESPLAGNSVYMDRMFLSKYMPNVDKYLHYRIIDVSTVKELCKTWNYNLYQQKPVKKYTHRALLDIKESIEELRFYRNNFLKLSH